jgi:hypothetical protein
MARNVVAASSQYLDTAAAVVSAPPFTIAAWFKPVSAAVLYELVTIESATGATKYLGVLQLNAGTVRAASSDGTNTGVASATGTYSAGAWAHAAAVFAGTADRAAFLNGFGPVRNTTSVTTPTVGVTEIGRLFNSGGSPTQYFDGDVAEVGIWNVALTTEEIVLLSVGVPPSQVRPSALVGYWPLVGSSSPEPDSGSGAHAMTVHGATQSTHPSLLSLSSSRKIAVLNVNSDISSQFRPSSLRITDTMGKPTTLSARMDGMAPTVGNYLKVIVFGDDNAARLAFAGEIVSTNQVNEGQKSNLAYDIYAVDYTRLLDRRLPFGAYSASATSIVQSLISSYGANFTFYNVQLGLATVSATFDGTQTMSDALTQLASLVGGYWYVDFAADVHFYTSEGDAPSTLTNPLLDPTVEYTIDLTQIRNRINVCGLSTTTTAAVPAGTTILPVTSSAGFSGGSVLVNGSVYSVSAVNFAVNAPIPDFCNSAAVAGDTLLGVGNWNASSYHGDGNGRGACNAVGQILLYSSISGGALRGIPASGAGAIIAAIASATTSTVTDLPCIILGSGLASALPAGTEVQLFVQRNDTAAQSSLSGLEGGDGIHEYLITDSSLTTVSACQARGDAELALYASSIVSLKYATRDTHSRAGKTLTVSLGAPTNISTTLRIQRVTVDQFDASGRLTPRYTVEASSVRFSLEDLLRQLAQALGRSG